MLASCLPHLTHTRCCALLHPCHPAARAHQQGTALIIFQPACGVTLVDLLSCCSRGDLPSAVTAMVHTRLAHALQCGHAAPAALLLLPGVHEERLDRGWVPPVLALFQVFVGMSCYASLLFVMLYSCQLPSHITFAGIYDTLKECACISKSAGGIGLSMHNIRATGSYIRGTNGTSNGIVPMLRVFNDTGEWPPPLSKQAAGVQDQPASFRLPVLQPATWTRAAASARAHSPCTASLGTPTSLTGCASQTLYLACIPVVCAISVVSHSSTSCSPCAEICARTTARRRLALVTCSMPCGSLMSSCVVLRYVPCVPGLLYCFANMMTRVCRVNAPDHGHHNCLLVECRRTPTGACSARTRRRAWPTAGVRSSRSFTASMRARDALARPSRRSSFGLPFLRRR